MMSLQEEFQEEFQEGVPWFKSLRFVNGIFRNETETR